MSPSLTHDASVWFDSQVRSAMSDIISTPLTDLAWLTSTLPPSCGGLGLTSCMTTRHAAHYASWAASWANMSAMFPAVFSGVDPSSSPLPFAVGLRAAHRRVYSALTALTDNNNDLPLPPFAPASPNVPEPSDLSSCFPHAQKCFAAVVHSARWLDGFHVASTPHRAIMLSQSQQGAMSAFCAVPSPLCKHAMLPMSFITAIQLRLRLPLTLLQGITRCKCGRVVDPYGDHILSCSHFLSHRTPWHDLIVGVVKHMSSSAAFHVSLHCPRMKP